MVLHNVSDDAEFVKVASATLSSEWFLEGDDDGGNVVAVPSGPEDSIPEPDGHQILHHFLAQVVINSVQLFLFEERGQVVGKGRRGLGIFSEWFLDDDASPSRFCHGGLLQVGRHRDEDGRRQGQVEKPVGIGRARFTLRDDGVQVFEIGFLS